MLYTKEELEETIEYKIAEAEKKFGKPFKFALIELASLIKMQYSNEKQTLPKLIELSKWNEHHAYPTVGALRQYYFKRHENGFDSVCEHGGAGGGRILIIEDKFFDWLSSRKKLNKRS